MIMAPAEWCHGTVAVIVMACLLKICVEELWVYAHMISTRIISLVGTQ